MNRNRVSHRPMKRTVLLPLLFLAAHIAIADELPSRDSIVRGALPSADGVWRDATKLLPKWSSRDLFIAALTYCEAHTNLNRLEKFFDIASSIQDRNPTNKTYGNFLWDSHTPTIIDKNAVDFCMQAAAPIWILHRDEIPPAARAKLKELVEIGVAGLKVHRVNDDYTNIGLMNAGNLILLGESLEKPEFATEGAKRLDAFIAAMRRGGTHEYNSPTYYGVDLDDLVLLEALTKNEKVRAVARELLEYFWTDIALNWFAPAQKLGGARSRDYDYLRGIGGLDQQLMANGWLATNAANRINNIFPAFIQWRPPASLRELAMQKVPRVVEQIWGPNTNQSRVNLICPDIALSTASGGYGGWMDIPLSVDFAGERTEPRGYFIPDGRHDPYGKVKIMERSGHTKTLHLSPWWGAIQRHADALGVVAYRPADVATNMVTSLESHFVLPLKNDGVWIGEKKIEVTGKEPFSHDISASEPLVLRRGTAAVGIRIPWARDIDGKAAVAKFVFDKNDFGVARVTVDHGKDLTALASNTPPGAAFWIRIGSGLKTDADFESWRKSFASADTAVKPTQGGFVITAIGIDGPMQIIGSVPFKNYDATIKPTPARDYLSIDGDDLGKKILNRIAPLTSATASPKRP